MGIAIGQAVRKTAAAKGLSLGAAKIELLKACESGIIRARWSGYHRGGSPLIPRQEFRDADIDIEKHVLILSNGDRKGDVYLDDADIEAWLAGQTPAQVDSKPENDPAEKQDTQSEATRKRGSPTLDRAKQAINELYPKGPPTQAELSNPLLCKDVVEHLKDKKIEPADIPSEDTILRAAGRRK